MDKVVSHVATILVCFSLSGCKESTDEVYTTSMLIQNRAVIKSPLSGDLIVENTAEPGSWYALGDYQGIPGYSGALATYTSSHTPVAVMFDRAIYSTFSSNKNGYLEIFVKKNNEPAVRVAVLAHTTDPHQNASLNIDKDGYIWVFISSRGIDRKGYTFKSVLPLVLEFRLQSEHFFAYPQPWFTNKGLSVLYSGYEKESGTGRFLRTIMHQGNGCDVKVVDGGHYFVSHLDNNKLHVFYNWTPNGNVSTRKNLYYIKSEDGGCTWSTRNNEKLELPIDADEARALVYDSGKNNVYLSDAYVSEMSPVALFVISPNSNPRNGEHRAMLYHAGNAEFIADIGHQYNVGYYYTHDADEFVLFPAKGVDNYAGGDLVLYRRGQQGWAVENVAQGSFNFARRVFNGHGHGIVSEGSSISLSPVTLYNTQIR